MAIPTVAGGWLLHAEHVCVVDHHPAPGDIKPDESIIEPVGSATTILVERIRTLAQVEALRTLTLTLTLTLTHKSNHPRAGGGPTCYGYTCYSYAHYGYACCDHTCLK